MGVQGLLQKVKSIVQQVHLSDFEGQTLAVDGASWLHKGVLSCAAELERGEPTEAFLNYPLAMVETMQLHGVSPLVVFDGGMLPAKLSMHRQRAETRTLNRQKAANLIGTAGAERTIDAALRKAVGVTPEMARRLITELRARDIRYLVAPYEADPQLAFLVREGYAAAVVSEDSDLLPYGCARVLFKLERDSARADLIELDDLQAVEDNGAHLFDGAWDGEWSAWRDGLLQSMCVLAGTDYLASLPQVGIVKAHAAVRRHRQLRAAACELGHAQRLDPAAVQEYARRAERAQLVFRHQLVYDPATDCVRPLTPLPPGLLLPESERDELFGRMLEPALARQVCRDASLNPISRKPYGILAGLPAISLLARRLAPALCDDPITRGGPAATGSVCEPAGAAAGAAAWPGAEAGSGASGVAAAVAAPPGVAGMAAAVAGVAAAAVGATASLAAEDEFGPDAIRAAVGAAAALNAGAVNAGAANAGAVNAAAVNAAAVNAGGDVEARFDVGARTGVEARAGVNASLAAGASTAVNELLAVNAAPAFHSGVVGAGVLFAGAGHAGPAKRPRVDSDRMETELLHAAGFVSVQCSGAGRAGGAVCGGGERRPGDARPSHASSSAADRLQGGAAGPAGVADRLTDSGSAPDAVHRRDGAACDAQGHDGGAAGGAAGGGGASMWWAVAEWAAATGEHPLLQVLSREGDDSLLADSTPTDAQVSIAFLLFSPSLRELTYPVIAGGHGRGGRGPRRRERIALPA